MTMPSVHGQTSETVSITKYLSRAWLSKATSHVTGTSTTHKPFETNKNMVSDETLSHWSAGGGGGEYNR